MQFPQRYVCVEPELRAKYPDRYPGFDEPLHMFVVQSVEDEPFLTQVCGLFPYLDHAIAAADIMSFGSRCLIYKIEPGASCRPSEPVWRSDSLAAKV